MRYLVLVCFFIITACGSVKEVPHEKDIYELIIEDIKNSKSFLEFKKERGVKKDGFSVYLYEFPFCSFYFLFSDTHSVFDVCKDVDRLEPLKKSDVDDLDKYSDKRSKRGFNVYISERISNRIGVEIIARKEAHNWGLETLSFLYKINPNKTIELVDVAGFIEN